MNKLKSTFKRRSSIKDPCLERKRSEVFLKKLEESKKLSPEQANKQLTSPLMLDKADLSVHELNAYQTWWKDLDPFGIGKSDNQAVFQFVSGCGLADATLEKILSFYQNQKDGLTREEFFAILRLIAHAQNGRTINRDIVYLGAPLPSFQTQAIDALMRRSLPTEPVRSCDDRLPVFSTSLHASPASDNPSWMLPIDRTVSLNIDKNNTYTPTTQHSRSKSVPFNFYSTAALVNQPYDTTKSPGLHQFDTSGASKIKQQRYPYHQRSSHSSLDADSLQEVMDTGQSLLLTKSFKPNYSVDNDDDENKSNNYINKSSSNSTSSSSGSSYKNSFSHPINSRYSRNPYLNTNPFETDESSATTPRLEITVTPPILPQSPPPEKSVLCHNLANSIYNSERIPPPPVPLQSTKPAYPKYARRRA